MTSLRAARAIATLDMLAEYKHSHRLVRGYLGASIIGHACDAYCAMDLRGWPTKKKPSTIRAAWLGQLVELLLLEAFSEAGFEVQAVDPATGKQYEFTSHDDKFRCHPDGFVTLDGVRHVLEIKSAKRSRFLKMQGKGIREGDRIYYDQVMTEMGMSEVHQALFLVMDKDSGEFYAEIIEFDPFHWAYIQMKIDRVLDGGCEKISSAPEYWRCKQCDRATWCWEKGKPAPVGVWRPQEKTA
jgi:hypothetical protein